MASETSFYRLPRADEHSITGAGPTNGLAHALGGSQGQYALKGQLHSAIRFVTPTARRLGCQLRYDLISHGVGQHKALQSKA